MTRTGNQTSPVRTIRVGISSCLLGESVRFDGGHQRDAFLTDTFGRFVEWVAICPEVECGLGTPRESMRLVRVDDGVRLLTVKTAVDLTAQMETYVRRQMPVIAAADLSGYVVKKDSPSCGLERVKVYNARGMATKSGRGIFAAALVDKFPHLPIEEEGRLSDPKLRENFVERAFAYRRLQELFSTAWSVGGLVRFHTAHKLILMPHSPEAYRQLGRLTATASTFPRRALAQRYTEAFMNALNRFASIEFVEAAFVTEGASRTTDTSPALAPLQGLTPDLSTNQTYLNAAPTGIEELRHRARTRLPLGRGSALRAAARSTPSLASTT